MPLRASLLATLFAGLVAAAGEPKPVGRGRVLPGLGQDGLVQLPNQWKLNPAGKQTEVGDLPVNIVVHPTGQFVAVLHCGMREHEVVVMATGAAGGIASRTVVKQAFYGLAFSPDGKQLYASGGEFDVVHFWDFDKGQLHNARTLEVKTPGCGPTASSACRSTTRRTKSSSR